MIEFILLAVLATGAPVYLGTYLAPAACEEAKLSIIKAVPPLEAGSSQRILWISCKPTNLPVQR